MFLSIFIVILFTKFYVKMIQTIVTLHNYSYSIYTQIVFAIFT